MKIKIKNLFIALAIFAGIHHVAAQGTAFTYQGKLASGTNAANGLYDFSFAAYDAASGGTQKGSTISTNAVAVASGYFMVTLDFGNVFPGNARWLDISVKTNGAGSYTALTPRQPLTPAPYAIMAGSASNVLGALPAAQLSGAVGNSQLANSYITVSAGSGLSGGGLIALGGTTTLNNAGVLSVTGNEDITASPTTGNVGLGSTATDANTASRIVKRDGIGNFSAGTVTLNGNLNLPTTTAFEGIVTSGGDRLLHAYGTGNSFVGLNAGNLTMTGTGNSANGAYALFSNMSGIYNAANGFQALYSNTNGNFNTAVGIEALLSNTSGSENTAVGGWAMQYNLSGNDNTAVGNQALQFNTTGNYNIALGNHAGYSLTTGNYNIDIGNMGVAGENQTIRIGTQGTQTNTSIAGIYGNTVSAGTPVYVDSTGKLGTGASSPVALLSANQTFTGIVTFNNAANIFTGNGSGLTFLNASQLASGTVPEARLSGNIARLNATQTFSGQNTFSGATSLGSTLRLNGNAIYLREGSDQFHGLSWAGSSPFAATCPDGPVLFGATGGGLGFSGGSTNLALAWNNAGGGTAFTDPSGVNTGTLLPGLTFGPASGEGISSKRTSGTGQFGLDFYTDSNLRLRIGSTGNVGIGTNNPQVALHVVGSERVTGLLRLGSETGTSDAPAYPAGSDGLLIRRISSTTYSSNNIVARTDKLTLIRDGTFSGLNIVFGANAGRQNITATGVDRNGNQVTRKVADNNSLAWTVVFSDAQKVVHYDISFGDTYNPGHTCHVVLDRYDDTTTSDHYLVGTVTSTYNQ